MKSLFTLHREENENQRRMESASLASVSLTWRRWKELGSIGEPTTSGGVPRSRRRVPEALLWSSKGQHLPDTSWTAAIR